MVFLVRYYLLSGKEAHTFPSGMWALAASNLDPARYWLGRSMRIGNQEAAALIYEIYEKNKHLQNSCFGYPLDQ